MARAQSLALGRRNRDACLGSNRLRAPCFLSRGLDFDYTS